VSSFCPATGENAARPQLFDNARIIDPASGRDEQGSLLIAEGRILAAGARNQGAPEGAIRHNLGGKTVIPGLVDSSCFIGAAERPAEATPAAAAEAAARGGITALIAISDQGGAIYDSPAALRNLIAAGGENGAAIYPAAALTKKLAGRELAEYGLCRKAGAVALADGQLSHADSQMLRRAFLYAHACGLPVITDTQDSALSHKAVATESFTASLMGLDAAPAAAESLALARDIALIRLTEARYHAGHISTAAAVEMVKAAKAEGLPVSAGVSIHHLSFNEQDISGYDSRRRFWPPLRAEEDRKALIAALREGAIACLNSCHQPRGADAKARPFAEAAAGSSGLEILLPAALRLYHNGEVPLIRLIDALSTAPARLFGLPGGGLAAGAAADFAIVDLDSPWQFRQAEQPAGAGISAYDGAKFEGQIIATYRGGRCLYQRSGAAE